MPGVGTIVSTVLLLIAFLIIIIKERRSDRRMHSTLGPREIALGTVTQRFSDRYRATHGKDPDPAPEPQATDAPTSTRK